VGFKHVYLSKTVVHQQNHAFKQTPLGQDKKAYWNFVYGLATSIKSTENSWL
jgi:hypothetical protein